MQDLTKTPRLYIESDLREGESLTLEGDLHHYIKNVMRVETGSFLRIFNEKNGEFSANVNEFTKKATLLTIKERIREKNPPKNRLHLLFPPLKKERMDFLIEKSVELGATDLHLILTQNSDIRKINEDRTRRQIIEAAEQCERLDIPALHPAKTMAQLLRDWPENIPLFAAIERINANPLPRGYEGDCALFIGPAGGFTMDEKEILANTRSIRPVSLGDNILRAETAAIAGLSILRG